MEHHVFGSAEKTRIIAALGRYKFQKIEACLKWLKGFMAERDVIHIKFPLYEEYFRFTFPIRPEDVLLKLKFREPETSPTFIITAPQTKSSDWATLYASPLLEMLERKTISSDKDIQPLRFGLTLGEKKLILETARATLKILLENGRNAMPEDFNFSLRFLLKTNIVISLWLNDKLRGARLSRDSHLGEGIIDATTAAAKDHRFEHVRKEEINLIRIQATLFGSLRIPLTRDEIKENIIYRNLGYEMHFNEKVGVFLPHVLKLRPPKDLHSYLAHLAREKVGIPDNLYDIDKTRVFTFNIEDFIEDEELNVAPFSV